MSCVAATAVFVVTVCVLSAGPAAAGPNTNLCGYNDSRGPVQDSFVLDACVDGNSIVVSNNHSFPVAVFRSPADNNTGADLQGVGAAQPVLLSQTTYAKATRSAYLVSKASGDLLLPGDILRYPIGPGKAEIDVSQVSDYMNAFYALASALSSVTRYNYADSLSAWAQALVQGKLEYNHCLAAKNASVVRCTAVATWVITKNALLLLGNLALRGLPNVLSAFAGFVQGLTAETFVFDQSTAYLIQDPLLAITTKSLSDGSVGSSYSQTVQATGGTTPYSWSISSGSLPPGLSINRTTGEISGTPSAAGYFSFEVTVTDSSTGANPGTAKQTVALSVAGSSPTGNIAQSEPTGGSTTFDTTSCQGLSFTTKQCFTDQLATTGQSGPVRFTVTSTSPFSVSSSGAITVGRLLGPGSYTVSGTDSDGSGGFGTWTYTLTVTDAGPGGPVSLTNPGGGLILSVPNVSLCGTYDPNTNTAVGGCFAAFYAMVNGKFISCGSVLGCVSFGWNNGEYQYFGNTYPFPASDLSGIEPDLVGSAGTTPSSGDYFWCQLFYWDDNQSDPVVPLGFSNAVSF